MDQDSGYEMDTEVQTENNDPMSLANQKLEQLMDKKGDKVHWIQNLKEANNIQQKSLHEINLSFAIEKEKFETVTKAVSDLEIVKSEMIESTAQIKTEIGELEDTLLAEGKSLMQNCIKISDSFERMRADYLSPKFMETGKAMREQVFYLNKDINFLEHETRIASMGMIDLALMGKIIKMKEDELVSTERKLALRQNASRTLAWRSHFE